jgi:hypothetical protein
LIILAVVLGCGAAAWFFMHQKKKNVPQKKRRAVQKPVAESKEAVPEARPLIPAPQVRTVTAVKTTAVPIATAVPTVMYAAPQPVVPLTTVQAAPPAYTTAPRAQTAMELFDELDVNKDGAVSREEFARVAAMRGIQI